MILQFTSTKIKTKLLSDPKLIICWSWWSVTSLKKHFSNTAMSTYLVCHGFIYVLHSISFQTFCTGIENWRTLLKIHYIIAIHLMRWLTNFYDFRFKWTVTAAIGMHPTKACLSQLVNFKNAIWMWGHFRRTICNRILF